MKKKKVFVGYMHQDMPNPRWVYFGGKYKLAYMQLKIFKQNYVSTNRAYRITVEEV